MESRERKTMLTAHAPIQHIKTGKKQKGKKKLKRNDKQTIEREPVQYYKKTQQLKKKIMVLFNG